MLGDADIGESGPRSIRDKAMNAARSLWVSKLVRRAALMSGACFFGMVLGSAALHAATFTFRLSPGPRLVGTRAASSGGGSFTATMEGNKLTLKGSYHGLLAVPTGAHLFMGSLPGVRGPLVADLTVSPATTGMLSGVVELNSKELAALYKGGLYVEIDSDKAPDGDMWGWLYPFGKMRACCANLNE
jgi:CHRD domain